LQGNVSASSQSTGGGIEEKKRPVTTQWIPVSGRGNSEERKQKKIKKRETPFQSGFKNLIGKTKNATKSHVRQKSPYRRSAGPQKEVVGDNVP